MRAHAPEGQMLEPAEETKRLRRHDEAGPVQIAASGAAISYVSLRHRIRAIGAGTGHPVVRWW
jgi:succinyl-CoA synthetase beta subunit